MNLWLRLILQLLKSRFAAALEPLGTSVRRGRVWPTDLDVSLHMNNGRYLTLMDLGRLDLMLRTGVCTATMGLAPTRQFVIQWSDAHFCCTDDPAVHLNFEVVLNETSNPGNLVSLKGISRLFFE